LDLELIPPNWRKAAHDVLLSRALDELEIKQLTPQGKVKYQFSAGGHELAQVLLAQALNHPHDAVMAYYRSRPFVLASGISALEALVAGMARSGSISEGRDVGVIFNIPGLGGLTLLPTSGDVGAQFTPSAGWAQAITYYRDVAGDREWQGALAVAMGGEGSVAANGFWSALNITTTLQLPMLFFIEDNGFGISTPATLQTPGGAITSNLAAFKNLKTLDGDGTHPLLAWEAIQEAVQHLRSGAGPCLLRMRVVRLAGHTLIDDQSYKNPELRAAEAALDPVKRLVLAGLEPEEIEHIRWQVEQELAEAVEIAELAPEPDHRLATRHLFYESAPQQGGLRPLGLQIPLGKETPQFSGPRINFVDAVRKTLQLEMHLNPRLLVFGEDVGVKGGVHGATMDLQTNFGAGRVFDTSLSEEGIIGRSTGLAIAGLLPVPEIQFRKYADPAFEQLNDIGTLRWRTANRFAAPVVVRIPVGFGKKTGDPWHSVSGEAIYSHLLGWRIAYPSNAADAVGLLRSALRGDDPTFFLEHRALLDTPEGRRPYPGDEYYLPFGKAAALAGGDSVTLVTWGAMTARCLEAIRPFQGRITLLDLRTIIPWDQELVLDSVRQTGKVLIVHEDTLTSGFAAEIMAVISNQAFNFLDAPLERLAPPDIPIPYNIAMMDWVLPSVEKIQEKIQALLKF
jgi:2-oxoisovalerate dehydrogenase E1 component